MREGSKEKLRRIDIYIAWLSRVAKRKHDVVETVDDEEKQITRRAIRAPLLILYNNLLTNCNIIIFVFIQIIYFIFVKILHVRLTVFKVSRA